jgi:adenylate cyclase
MTDCGPGFRLSYTLEGQPAAADFHQPKTVIGRSGMCDLVLPLPGMSRRHAWIGQSSDGWSIFDLDSRNGTYVNGRAVTSRPLADGDRITFGAEGLIPVTVTFHELTAGREGRVVFDDDRAGLTINMSLNVEDLERAGAGEDAWATPAVPGAAGTAAPPPAAGARPQARASVVQLFKRTAEILLAAADLDDMLGQIVGLALERVPAQRGVICLCDDLGRGIVPRTARTRGVSADQSIAISHSIARAAVESRQAVLVGDAPRDARFAHAESVRQMSIRSAMCAPLYHAGRVEGLIYVDTLDPHVQFEAHDLELLAALGGLAAVGIEQVRLREDVGRERSLREWLARYLSPAVVDQAAAQANACDGEMVSEQREVSVLFGDLCGFTALAEGMPPAEVAALLNSAFEQLHRAVFMYEGTLDKYMGDAVMAIFGAPLDQPDHAERAVRTALRMQELLERFNRSRPERPPLRMRIGINSGTAVAGDLGSPIRREYTVIGDAVNVASRLESSVAAAGQIVIGPETYQRVKDRFACRPLPEVTLRGKLQPMRPFLVLGPRGREPVVSETVRQPAPEDEAPTRT